ncbi:MAG: aminodeoxychorismate lyase [Kangiellaceae bacterium]|jgi:4-amino-4-deoxychorismate lyase|nr:aminodeoxychorismate lyase [Kangiellaceae bacterium]
MIVTRIDSDSTISPHDRGLLYGDGFFTTCLVYNSRVVFWNDHKERISHSAERLAFSPIDIDAIDSQLADLPKHAVVKIVITRGVGSRGYAAPAEANINCLIYVTPYCYRASQPINVAVSDIPISRNKAIAGIKHLNRLDNVLAKTALAANHSGLPVDDALMLDQANVVCSTQANIFTVSNGQVFTPSIASSGVEGVFKKNVKRWCRNLGLTLQECQLSLNDIYNAEELFLTNCLKAIMPVKTVGKTTYNQPSYSQRLLDMYHREINYSVASKEQ